MTPAEKRDQWQARHDPHAMCACGHTFVFHATDTAKALCSVYEYRGLPVPGKCMCSGFQLENAA